MIKLVGTIASNGRPAVDVVYPNDPWTRRMLVPEGRSMLSWMREIAKQRNLLILYTSGNTAYCCKAGQAWRWIY